MQKEDLHEMDPLWKFTRDTQSTSQLLLQAIQLCQLPKTGVLDLGHLAHFWYSLVLNGGLRARPLVGQR